MGICEKKNQFKYSVPEHGEDLFPLESFWGETDLNYVAQNAAEDYHTQHDGWEATWPLTFAIYDMQGTLLGKFEVEREMDPVFYATIKDSVPCG